MKTDFDATGDVRAVDLLAAFVGIWRGNRSGSVRFTRSGSSAGFDFADGDVVGAFSSDPRFETSAILVRAGKLDSAALERLTVPPGTDAALAALQAGILTRREWKWGEKIRAIEILAELLGWPDGKYLFDFDARPSRGEFSLAIPRLILELFLRSRDRHLIDHQLGPMDVPLTRSEKFEEEFATFGLTADAESVVHLIDGEASASEICARAPAEEFAVLKLLAALRTLGLLAPASPDERPAILEPPAGAREPVAADMEAKETLPAALIAPPEDSVSEAKRFSFPSIDPFPSPVIAAAEVSSAEEPIEQPEASAPDDAALDVEVGDAAPGWEGGAAQRDWENPSDELDRELDTAIEPPVPPNGGFPWGRVLWVLLGVLVLAVAGLVFFQSRRGPDTVVAAGRTDGARLAAPTSRPTLAVAAAATPTAAVSPQARPSPTRALPPTATPRPQPPKATPVPAKPAAPKADPGRGQWIARARSDRRKLDQDTRTRYAVQLELVCETPSLAEAWKHDQPPGSMWLLAFNHQGRECFRVLWGRFPSLEAARKAKGGAPLFFSTATNHPAVVSVR